MEPDDEALKELAAASTRPPQRRGISYSQPLSRGDAASARRAAGKLAMITALRVRDDHEQ